MNIVNRNQVTKLRWVILTATRKFADISNLATRSRLAVFRKRKLVRQEVAQPVWVSTQ